jgi:pimeloyl-ACP methyl ester carboxylesterase
VPCNYYPDDDPSRPPQNRWRSHAHLLYGNWINEIYQTTPRREAFRETALQRKNLLDEITALHDRYGEVSVPTEILHGTADTIVGLSIHSDKLVGQIPDAQLDRLDGIGHMPHHVATDAVTAAIDRVAAAAGLR